MVDFIESIFLLRVFASQNVSAKVIVGKNHDQRYK